MILANTQKIFLCRKCFELRITNLRHLECICCENSHIYWKIYQISMWEQSTLQETEFNTEKSEQRKWWTIHTRYYLSRSVISYSRLCYCTKDVIVEALQRMSFVRVFSSKFFWQFFFSRICNKTNVPNRI